jgi:hypothetical protein
LGNELGFNPHGDGGVETSRSLLTVMPQGFGYYATGDAPDVSEVVDGPDAPDGVLPNDLARATIDALPKLAKAAGYEITAPSVDSSKCPGSGGSSGAAVFVVLIALLLVAAAFIGLVARRRRSATKSRL